MKSRISNCTLALPCLVLSCHVLLFSHVKSVHVACCVLLVRPLFGFPCNNPFALAGRACSDGGSYDSQIAPFCPPPSLSSSLPSGSGVDPGPALTSSLMVTRSSSFATKRALAANQSQNLVQVDPDRKAVTSLLAGGIGRRTRSVQAVAAAAAASTAHP